MHGVDLVKRVIEKVEAYGLGILGHVGSPRPLSSAQIDALRFPNGAALPPSLRAWLAFDASVMGWFDDLDAPTFDRRDVRAVATAAYQQDRLADEFGVLGKQMLPGDGYLLPGGRLARRFLYAGEPDSAGELPVLVFDTDGRPYVGIDQPGFDVWLAVSAGLVVQERQVLCGLADDEVYGPRMKEHADRLFGGRYFVERDDEGFHPEAKIEVKQAETVLLGPADPLPEGYVVVDELVNPVTMLPMRLAAPAATTRERRGDG